MSLNAARGEREGAWIVVRGGRSVAATVERGSLGPLGVELAFGHFVRVGARLVPDALLPWGGDARPFEQANQPLYVRVVVPRETAPGSYAGRVAVTVDGRTIAVPLSVQVFAPTLPERALPTSFHVSPATYLAAVSRLHGSRTHTERQATHAALFRFLAEYGLSPSSWGFGEPRTATGYAASSRWWLDSATLMREAGAAGFPSMRIPISSNRASAANRIAGLAPAQPETWCDYLKSVRGFWEQQGWLGRMPFVYSVDEPDRAGQRLVARQSKALHACWPGARTLMTGNPSPNGTNRFLSDGRDGDDVDIWAVLSRRYYGQFTVPAQKRSRERELATTIQGVRRAASVWSYTYSAVAGTPGFSADEPLSNPRMFFLWNALEGLHGVLYGQGTTSYDAGDPLVSLSRGGGFVLLYPGDGRPIPSARLEQIRDGIEDWALLDLVRRKRGAGEVRAILGGAGLFSASRRGVTLACTMGCKLRSATKFSWPVWSRDASSAARIERARAVALRRAG
ncbi:MAG: DUF4091 domain-containing protein [Chloroflexi bacterium]|nr:DUF4091 domain-containing protein [Chloroflexota bacterium]